MDTRASGILMHITSLPSEYGIGDLGPGAFRFCDFLAETRQRYWQILPINPINPACAYSPYSSTSAFAGNIYLISPQFLVDDGYLSPDDVPQSGDFSMDKCDYEKAIAFKSFTCLF